MIIDFYHYYGHCVFWSCIQCTVTVSLNFYAVKILCSLVDVASAPHRQHVCNHCLISCHQLDFYICLMSKTLLLWSLYQHFLYISSDSVSYFLFCLNLQTVKCASVCCELVASLCICFDFFPLLKRASLPRLSATDAV